jgi:hypothetical protein
MNEHERFAVELEVNRSAETMGTVTPAINKTPDGQLGFEWVHGQHRRVVHASVNRRWPPVEHGDRR